MNKLVSLFFAFGVLAASAAPLVFNNALLAGHADMVKVMHGAHVAGTAKLRFLFLLPKMGAAVDAFHSGAEGAKAALNFLEVPAGHRLVHLLGFANCHDWLAVHVTFFGANGLVHKFMGGAKTNVAALADLAAFVDHLHTKMTLDAFKGLWPLLPAHHVVLALHAKFGL